MVPPGRWRNSAMSPMTMLLAILFLLTATARAGSSVLGVDFGTLNIKAALVKPGIPLEIVLSKDSKRKETAAVAFKPTRDSKNNIIAEVGTFPERVYGGDALSLQGRMPSEVFPNLKPLLGLTWSEAPDQAIETYKERYPAIQVVQNKEMGTTMIKSSAFADEELPWSVEELLAMELANIKRNAETLAGKGSLVEDVVITVPAFYTAEERRAIEKAAALAELNVNGLISDGLAVGLDYAKSRTFPEVTSSGKPEHHLVFDMGAGSTTATLLRFQSRSVKDIGRFNKTVQEVAVLGVGYDRTLGGDSLNHVILDDYIQKLIAKPALKSKGIDEAEIKGNGRLMSRMWKEVEKARQVLSANTETSSGFEELLPDIDFRTKLSRTEFEALASPFADRVSGPVNEALADAKLTIDDIDSIILHGGAVRTPFVQKKLEDLAGAAKIRGNVNADESAVFGAAFKGAGLSPSFKVKEIRDSDIALYPAGISYIDGGKERKQALFTTTSPVGYNAATKQFTFKDTEDFTFDLYQSVDNINRPVLKVQTDNLTASVKALNTKFGCEQKDVTTKFSFRLNALNGLPDVVGGFVSCEVDNTLTPGSVGDSVKDWLGLGKKKDQDSADGDESVEELEAEEPASSTSKSAAKSATKSPKSSKSLKGSATPSSSKVPEKPKKRTETIQVAFSTSTQGNPQPSPEEFKRMRERLAAFDRSDRARLAREEALNVLESFTYYVRDFVDNEDYSSVSTKDQRTEISKLLATTQEWMESSEFAKATEAVLKDKLAALKKLVTPIQSRRKQDLERPSKVKALRSSLEQTQKLMEMVQDQIERASAAQSKASEYEASRSEAAAASAIESGDNDSSTTDAPSPSDDFADLEEPDASTSSSTTDAPPKYTDPADFSPYTDADLTDVKEIYESVSTWLEEKEAQQKELKSYEDPVLLVKDIEAKAARLSTVIQDLLYKKMKTPPKPKKSSTSKNKPAKKTKTKASASTTEAPGAEESAAEEKPHFSTVTGDDDMPTEEEILQMVADAKAKQEEGHDEL
ncbi:hypoxia up-regulated protein 1 [Acrodontium crateriforme]|uniref:Hypoxia up-regulated protein 1 n=1 Tax=Acrodontium crateriforme TaxID=150365 RepID=A0AAQ3MBG9_9PEZI|nr:hypoxia up-regulated protein 1 [Acrodontium crateriforme]